MKDKKPTITNKDIRDVRVALLMFGYPSVGYLDIVDGADIYGYSTFDLRTMEIINKSDGYFVSFQVNKAINVRRDYSQKEYDLYVYECILRSGSVPYLGTYGNAEISFHVKDKNTAMQMAIDYNQASIYDVLAGVELNNPQYDWNENPTEV